MPTTKYIWDPLEDSIRLECDENGSVTARYTTDPEGRLISQFRNGQPNYFHFDAMGNVTEMTDGVANVVATRRYSAFGEIIESTGSGDSPFQFGGRMGYYRDAETGDYYIRARMYACRLGRWMSIDPLNILVLIQKYAFAKQNPLRYVDPSGMQEVDTDDERCSCQEFVDALEMPITVKPDPFFKKPKFEECTISVECRDDCDGYPGKAYPPDAAGHIVICLSNQARHRKTLHIIYEHELEHARQLCGGAKLESCTGCINWETKAHELSCAIAFPDDADRQADCVKCAVYLSCRKKCEGKPNAPSKPTRNCSSWADLGVTLPDFPFPDD